MLAPERHHLLVELLLVVLVLGLQLLHLRLQQLHRPLVADLLDEQREQEQPHEDREEHDRQRPGRAAVEPEDVGQGRVDVLDQPGDRLVERFHAAPSARGARGATDTWSGTGSYPPGWKGWQRTIRRSASQDP